MDNTSTLMQTESQVKGGIVKNADSTYSLSMMQQVNAWLMSSSQQETTIGISVLLIKSVTGEVKLSDDTYYFAKDGKQVKGKQ